MKKTAIIAVLATLIIFAGGVFFLSKEPQSEEIPSSSTFYEYFWGDGCPHCVTVANFFENWDKKDKFQITKYEVWNSTKNAALMAQRAKTCGITPSGMGVPFLVTPEGKCFSGDTPIIDYLKNL